MKTNQTFGVQFLMRTTKRKDGKALVYARITVNGNRLEISLKQTVDPSCRFE